MLLLINYSRSGGTLVSRCLASIDQVMLVSEVHPEQAAASSLHQQALDWYGVRLRSATYAGAVAELDAVARQRGQVLVVRDWTFLDITPCPLNGYRPSRRLSNLDLFQRFPDLRVVALVRDAIDVAVSRGCPPRFAEHYLRYVELLLERAVPVVRYEDLCQRPDATMAHLCSLGGIDDAAGYERFAGWTQVTGDLGVDRRSRGFHLDRIEELPRRQLPRSITQRLDDDPHLRKANALLGYPCSYAARPHEDLGPQWWIDLVGRVRSPFRDLPWLPC